MKILTTFFCFLFFLTACDVEEILSPTDQLKKDISIIKDYLESQNLLDKAIETVSGLHYYVAEPGTDTIFPESTALLYLQYRGYLTDGTTFDITSSRATCVNVADSCSTLELNETVRGFQEGLTFFSKGSKGSIFIPSTLGYGSSTLSGRIPANSVLIFDLDIINVFN